MAENLAQYFVGLLDGKLSSELIALIVSMFPILEIRGGMIAAKIMGLGFVKAFIFCYIGNLIPIPFILLFIRRIFNWLKRFKRVEYLIDKLEARSIRKAGKIEKYRLWGLLIFVAIPLPGTGSWTGSLVADLFDIRIKHSLPIIALGVLIAGFIMSGLTYGIFGVLGL